MTAGGTLLPVTGLIAREPKTLDARSAAGKVRAIIYSAEGKAVLFTGLRSGIGREIAAISTEWRVHRVWEASCLDNRNAHRAPI
jgi:ABC-type thiamin/hydroxymethylpyrimidine transport system permease subunit